MTESTERNPCMSISKEFQIVFFPIPISCEWRLQRACSKKESLSRDCFNTVLRHVNLSANVKVMLSTKSRHDVHLFIASNTIGCGFTELGTFYSSCSRFYSGRPMFRSRWARLLATYFVRHLRQPIFTPILVILNVCHGLPRYVS